MIKLILQKDVLNLGDAGDIKEVKDGYARNYLIPNRLAIVADKGNTKNAVHIKKLVDLKKNKRNKEMQELSSKLNNKSVSISVQTGENDKMFGTVTAIDIASALKAEGFLIDKRKIELDENIKTLGTFDAKIKLAEGIHSNITVNVIKAV